MELKPCPFCGCKRILITSEKGRFKILCPQCCAFMIRRAKPASSTNQDTDRLLDTQDEAYQNITDRWNRRTPIAASNTNHTTGD